MGGGEKELEDDEGVQLGAGGHHQQVRQKAAQNDFLLINILNAIHTYLGSVVAL